MAALVVVTSGRGDAVLVAALLALAGPPAGRGIPVLALAAVALRWGTTSLGGIAGAQAVLGAGAAIGPAAAVAASWAAASALVLATPRQLVGRVAYGVTAGFVLAGPLVAGDGGRLLLRAGAAVGATAVVLVVAELPPRPRIALAWVVAAAAAVCGAVTA